MVRTGENSAVSKNKIYSQADMLKLLSCICSTNIVCCREPKFLTAKKKKINQEQHADYLVSVSLDSQATGEQGERPGIPESDFILALLWTVT